MTEQESIEEAERIVSRAGRGRSLFAVAVGTVFLVSVAALAGAIVANVVNARQGDDITKVTQKVESACAVNASGKKCQRIKREADVERSVRDTCIAFWKVGYPCPAPSSGVSLPAAAGGDALQPADAGQQPTPAKAPAHRHGDVDRHTHPDPVDPAPKAPAAEAPESSPPQTGKPAGEEAAGSATPAAEDTEPESGNGLLDDPGGTVGDLVCSVNALGIPVCTE